MTVAQTRFMLQYPQAKNAKPATVGAVTGLKLNQAAAWGMQSIGGIAYPHSAHLGRRVQRDVPMTIHEIQATVAARYGVTVLDIVSRRQGRATYRPRQVAMWLARHLTLHSLPEIGRAFGGRDHTTVMHGIWRVEQEIAAGSRWGGEAAAIKHNLAGRDAV